MINFTKTRHALINRTVLLTALLLVAIQVFGQPGEPGGGNPALDEEAFQQQSLLNQQIVVPPSPQAASLGQYGNVEVGPYTGGLNFSLPLQSLQGRELNFPVVLNYSGSGNKVNELPTWVGLGWSLQAGGVVTRSVTGNPDMSYNYYGKQSEMNLVWNNSDQIDQNERMYDVTTGQLETQPDIYFISFPGFSGKFYILPDKKYFFKSDSDVKIDINWGLYDDIESFIVTDGVGNRYWFTYAERTTLIPDDEQIDPPIQYRRHDFNSSWHLSKIESASGKEEITISYYTETTPFTQPSTAFAQDSYSYTMNRPADGCGGYIGSTPFTNPTISLGGAYSINEIRNRRYLSSARLSRGGKQVAQLYFVASSTPNNEPQSYGGYQYKEWQLDRLDYQLGSGRTRYQNSFTYSEVTGRLSLESYQPYHFPAGKRYDFDYNGIALPSSVLSNKIDHWGYYNNNQSSSLVPSVDLCHRVVTAGGANRETDSYRVKAGLLEKIHYPTGGYTEITFESHRVADWSNCAILGAEKYGGGVRVKYLDDYAAAGQRAMRKEYRYVKASGGTSGIVLSMPVYNRFTDYKHYPEITLGGGPCVPGTGDYTLEKMTVSSSSLSSLGAVQGSNVGYSRVEEINDGKTVYHYRNTKLSRHQVDEHENGLLDLKEVFDSGGKVLARWEMEYAHVGNKTNHTGQNTYNHIGFTVEAKSLQDNQSKLCKNTSGNFYWVQTYQSTFGCNTSRVFKTKFEPRTYSLKQNNWNKTEEKIIQYFYDASNNSNGSLEKIKTYDYNDNKTVLPTEVTYTNSDGKVHKRTTRYTDEESPYASGTSLIRVARGEMPSRAVSQLYSVNGSSLYKGKTEMDGGLGLPDRLLNRFSTGADRVRETVELFGSHGEPLQTKRITDVPNSYVWAYAGNKMTAQVQNAQANEIAFTSFEDPDERGGWNYQYTSQSFPYQDYRGYTAKVGGGVSRLNKLTKTLLPAGKYVLSYWTKKYSETVLQGNASQIRVDRSAVDAQGWEFVVRHLDVSAQGTVSLEFWNYVDEVRLHPADALMTTFTYERNHQNLMGMGDPSGNVQRYAYDANHRLEGILDFDGNYVSAYDYKYAVDGVSTINAVETASPLVSGKLSKAAVLATPWDNLQRGINYVDGIGRGLQEVDVAGAPGGKDVIVPHAYDVYGREVKKYLPWIDASNGGSYRSGAVSDQQSYYQSEYGSTGGAYAYQEILLETSPLRRQKGDKMPGLPFHNNASSVKYRSNTSNEVRDLSESNKFYPANTLIVVESVDADGRTQRLFTDKAGRKVREDTGGSMNYFYYSGLGEVIRIVTPEGAKYAHQNLNYTINSGRVLYNSYQYSFNSTTNLLYFSRRPGEPGYTYYYYDRLERPVLTKYPGTTEREYTKYDILSRPIITGVYTGTSLPSNSNGLYEEESTGTHGYTLNGAFPQSGATVYQVTHYDDYDFEGSNFTPDEYPMTVTGGYGLSYPSRWHRFVRGLPTRVRTAVLKSDGSVPTIYTKATTFYDRRQRPIHIRSTNHLGGQEYSWAEFNFVGWALRSRRKINSPNNSQLITNERMTYDERGRVKDVYHRIGDSGAETRVSNHSYDDWGRESYKRIGYAVGGSYAQQVDYSYTINGWLTDINDVNNGSSGGAADLFRMRLHYETSVGQLQSQAQLTGNISAIEWRTLGENANKISAYGFNYDGNSRLTKAVYGFRNQGTNLNGSWQAIGRYNLETVTYDANGNIKTLIRKGKKADGSFGTIDDLLYSYNSTYYKDRLYSVQDRADIAVGFEAPTTAKQNLFYDGRGNVKVQANRQISLISYNIFNLPRQITKGGQVFEVIYDGAGRKLAQIDLQGNRKDYLSGLELRNGSFESLYHTQGRVKYSNGSWNYEYVLQDHLGNTRAVFKNAAGGGAELIESHTYFPFGMKNKGLNEGIQGYSYKFSGKEFNDDLGLYDYGARWYDPAIARWTSIDLLADRFPSKSAYIYAFNDPVNFMDPNGNFPIPDDFRSAYPILTKYIETQLKDYFMSSKRFSDGLLFYSGGGLTPEQINSDFQSDSGPSLVANNFTNPQQGGEYVYSSNTIMLSQSMLTRVENRLGNKNEKVRQSALLDFVKTFAHEYIHYGDAIDGLDVFLDENGVVRNKRSDEDNGVEPATPNEWEEGIEAMNDLLPLNSGIQNFWLYESGQYFNAELKAVESDGKEKERIDKSMIPPVPK